MNIEDIINDNKYIKIPLVGNKFCNKKPSSKDTDIRILRDVKNVHDKNALKVFSLRDNTKYHLGYIIKDKIPYVSSMLSKLKFHTIIKKISNELEYYYLVFTIN